MRDKEIRERLFQKQNAKEWADAVRAGCEDSDMLYLEKPGFSEQAYYYWTADRINYYYYKYLTERGIQEYEKEYNKNKDKIQ